MLKIRRYRPEDNAAVKELHQAGIAQMVDTVAEAGRAELKKLALNHPAPDLDDIGGAYINNRGDFLVGVQGNEIIVTGALRKYTDTCGELKRLRVRQDYQRQGHGETMIRRLIERAKELGYQELVLDTIEQNQPARRLFEKLGFGELGREIAGPFTLVIYGKRLKQEG